MPMPLLSLAMMVCNEERTLPRALASFEGVADEIVVIDTGSTDRTIEIAEATGCRVIRHPWNDSFSEARNIGLDAATCEWIFALDADEWLYPESRGQLRELCESTTADWLSVTRREETPGGTSDVKFVRIGRRSTGRRLVGRIHEHFDPPLENIAPSSIVIGHDGYARGPNPEKLARNVRLLEMELAERPDQLYNRIDYARTLLALGRPEWTSAAGEAFSQWDRKSRHAGIPALLETLLFTPAESLPPGIEHARLCQLAESLYPACLQLISIRAAHALSAGDTSRAIALGVEALQRWQAKSFDQLVPFNPSDVLADVHLNLGVALAKTGRKQDALKHLTVALRYPRTAAAAKANLAILQR